MTARKAVEPPPIVSAPRDLKASYWYLVLLPMTKKKGQWRQIRKYKTPASASQAALRIRTGQNKSLPEGSWDAVSRSCNLWVRFLGK